MKKVLAVAALLGLAGAAQAQVTMYGLIDMSIGQNQIGFKDQKVDFFSGGDNGSSQGNSTTRVGLKGSTVVAPGIKANFNLETAGITSNGDVGGAGTPFFNRQAWAGFSGSFGEVRLGKQDSVAFQTMVGFDFNGAANAASSQQNALAGTWFGAGGRQDRSLQYITPDMGGLKAQVGFQPKGNVAGAEDNLSLGVSYAAGPLALAVVGEGKRTNTGKDFYSVAGSYDLGVAKVMLGYADGGKDLRGTTFGITAPLAGVNVGLNYTVNSDTKAGATEIFVNKEIFKGTYAYFD
ncbi:MAG: hypothetical protein CFE44_17540, partial [Burkholderiales bacterium PBB4]